MVNYLKRFLWHITAVKKTKMDWRLFIDIIGWIGSVEVILAYGLVSTQRVRSDSFWYQFLNFTGGILLIVNTFYLESYPSTFINVVWVIIALGAFYGMFKRRYSKTKSS